MDNKFINLDSYVTDFFENDNKVLKLLNTLNIKTMDDLYKYNYHEFIDMPSVGSKTLDKIKKAYNYLNHRKETNININQIKNKLQDYFQYKVIVSKKSDLEQLRNVITFKELLDIYQNIKLSDRDKINVNAALEYITDNTIITEDTLNLLKLFNLDKEIDKNPFDTISPETAKFDSYKEAYKFVLDLINDLDTRNGLVFRMYNGVGEEKQTLEAIGNKLSLSRERVRQLNVQITNKIQESIERKITKFSNTFNDEFYIPNDNILLKMICEALISTKKYNKFEILDNTIYIMNGLENHYLSIIKNIQKEINSQKIYNFSTHQEYIGLKKLFCKEYLVKNEKIYEKAKSSLSFATPMLMKEIDVPLDLNNQKDVTRFYNTLELRFNIHNDYKNSRNLERVLFETCVLCGAHTYIHEDNIKKLEHNDITSVFNFINTKRVTTALQIYSTFENMWKNINIFDATGVYGYLKYFYPNDYNYGGRSFLISVSGEKTNWGEVVIDKIKQLKKSVSYEEINKEYEALNYNIWMSLPLNFDDLVSWGDNSIYCKSELNLSEEEINIITIYIFNKKMININELFSYLLLNHKYILDKNHIYNEKQLKTLLSIKLKDIIHIDNQNNNIYM